jgi:hypothetical protein
VDREPQSRRWKQVVWISGSILTLVVVLVLIRLGYAYRATGFGQYKVNGEVQPFKTLWDWLDLLIVPVVLALGGYLFTRSENQRTLQSSKQQREVDREVAKEQAETDREIADQRRQDDTLQAYLDGMSQLLTDREQPLHGAQPGDSLSTVARARTLTVLGRLNGGRKRSVLQFLYESGLIYKEKTLLNESDLIERRHNIVSLGGADLRGADLSGANLSGADLSRTNLLKTDLRGANLSGADLLRASLFETYLSRADLSGAYLVEAELYGAHLSSANLTNADLRGAYLGGAGLSDANLNDANLRNAQGPTGKKLEDMAKTLEGATMPDGSKHP